MNTPNLKEQLITKLDQLSEDELETLLEHIEILRYNRVLNSMSLPDDYQVENDGTVGYLAGTTDLAEHIEDILYGEAETQQPTQKAS